MHKKEDLKVDSIDLFITEKCNLNCVYCFHKQSPLTLDLEQGKKILDRMKQINPDHMSITFFGGEPLLYPDLVLQLAEYAKTLWTTLKMHISTNGTYFDEEMFKKYKALDISMQISFDGNEETQNGGRGEFELVRDNIIKTLKIYPGMTVRMTYTPETVRFLSHNVKFIHSLGVENIMHHATMESEWKENEIKEYQFQLADLYHYRRFCQRMKTPFSLQFIDKTMRMLNDEAPSELDYCAAGKTYIGILPNGDTYPCHRAASNRIFKLGNIFNEKRPYIRGMFLTVNKETTGCSKMCEAAKTCHTCVITHYLVNNDINRPLAKTGYCEICKIEDGMAKSYLPTEVSDKRDRLLNSLGLVVADISDKINELEVKINAKE
jgi:uncharacterized protein